MNQGDILGLVRELYEETDEDANGVEVEDLLDEATTRFEVEPETVRNALDYLKRKGEVYRPAPDEERYKPTTTTETH